MRYSRQELVIGKTNQKKLEKSKVCILGVGALGSLSAELLVRAGVRNLVLIDRDYIEEDNLQRQHLFSEEDVGKPKVIAAKERLEKINSKVKIKVVFDNLDQSNVKLLNSDLVLDCTDNMETRFLVNEYCRKNKIKWIFASAIKNEGYIFNVVPNGACFNCIFGGRKSYETCENVGVLNSASSLISSLQVSEAIKLLIGQRYEKDLIKVNLDRNELVKIKVSKNKKCDVCKGKYEYLEGNKRRDSIKLCGRNYYVIYSKNNINRLKKMFKNIVDYGDVFRYKEVTVFKDKFLVKALDEKKAKIIIEKYFG